MSTGFTTELRAENNSCGNATMFMHLPINSYNSVAVLWYRSLTFK